MSIYISTGAFQTGDIREILRTAEKLHIRNIEISPGLDYCEDILDILKQHKNEFAFLIHNYFPTPKEPFALNLASDKKEVVKKSIDMCKKAVDFAAVMDIPFYSVHCGFCFDTSGRELGSRSQIGLPRISYTDAREVFICNVRDLCVYAKAKNVKIAVENNVMAEYAKGMKGLYLGVTADDMLDLIRRIGMDNLGILLDLAHAKVSDTFLHFGMDAMIDQLKEYVLEVHASDNDGCTDQNLPVREGSDIFHYMCRFQDVPVTLEVYDLSPDSMIRQLQIAQKTREATGQDV